MQGLKVDKIRALINAVNQGEHTKVQTLLHPTFVQHGQDKRAESKELNQLFRWTDASCGFWKMGHS